MKMIVCVAAVLIVLGAAGPARAQVVVLPYVQEVVYVPAYTTVYAPVYAPSYSSAFNTPVASVRVSQRGATRAKTVQVNGLFRSQRSEGPNGATSSLWTPLFSFRKSVRY